MIGYKKSILERQSLSEEKMGRGSPICERQRLLIVEKFLNNIPQCKITKTLKISSSTVHNIIIRFRESGEIFVREGQGRKPILDARDLRALRRHCIKNRHDSVTEITAWAHFRKSLSVNTVRYPQIKALSCKEEAICEHDPETPSSSLGQSSFKMDWGKVENESKFLETMDAASSGLKMRGIIRLVIRAQYKSLHLWWYGVALVPMEWAACTSGKAPSMLKGI